MTDTPTPDTLPPTTPPAPAPTTVEPAAPLPAATSAAPAGTASALAWVALLLAIVGVGLSAWSWSDARERSRDLRTDMSRLLAESGKESHESNLLARNADDAMRAATERLNYLEAQFTSAQQQQVAIEALYKEMAQSRDNWTLAEVEPLLVTAAQQLQLAGNVRAAIVALETVDARLARQGPTQFAVLRRAVAQDLSVLRALPELDEIGVTARLEALANRIARLPLAGGQVSEADKVAASSGNLMQELLGELKSIVQIRRTEGSEGVLLPPNQAFFLRENLRLRLLSARLAVLARNQSVWRTDLAAARKLLGDYYDARHPGVAAARTELDKLVSLVIAPPLPDLDQSLDALGSYKAAH